MNYEFWYIPLQHKRPYGREYTFYFRGLNSMNYDSWDIPLNYRGVGAGDNHKLSSLLGGVGSRVWGASRV